MSPDSLSVSYRPVGSTSRVHSLFTTAQVEEETQRCKRGRSKMLASYERERTWVRSTPDVRDCCHLTAAG